MALQAVLTWILQVSIRAIAQSRYNRSLFCQNQAQSRNAWTTHLTSPSIGQLHIVPGSSCRATRYTSICRLHFNFTCFRPLTSQSEAIQFVTHRPQEREKHTISKHEPPRGPPPSPHPDTQRPSSLLHTTHHTYFSPVRKPSTSSTSHIIPPHQPCTMATDSTQLRFLAYTCY